MRWDCWSGGVIPAKISTVRGNDSANSPIGCCEGDELTGDGPEPAFVRRGRPSMARAAAREPDGGTAIGRVAILGNLIPLNMAELSIPEVPEKLDDRAGPGIPPAMSAVRDLVTLNGGP